MMTPSPTPTPIGAGQGCHTYIAQRLTLITSFLRLLRTLIVLHLLDYFSVLIRRCHVSVVKTIVASGVQRSETRQVEGSSIFFAGSGGAGEVSLRTNWNLLDSPVIIAPDKWFSSGTSIDDTIPEHREKKAYLARA